MRHLLQSDETASTNQVSLCSNPKSDKTVTNLDLTTKDNVTRDSFKIHMKRFAFIVASSVTNRMTINRQSYLQVGNCFITFPIYILTVTPCSFNDPWA